MFLIHHWKWKWKSLSQCLALWDPIYYTVHGILQARILGWVAFSFSRGSSQTQGSYPGLLFCRQILYQLSYEGSPFITETKLNSSMVGFSLDFLISYFFTELYTSAHVWLYIYLYIFFVFFLLLPLWRSSKIFHSQITFL